MSRGSPKSRQSRVGAGLAPAQCKYALCRAYDFKEQRVFWETGLAEPRWVLPYGYYGGLHSEPDLLCSIEDGAST